LAKRLLRLSGNRFECMAASAIWTTCEDRIIKKIKHQTLRISFSNKTWDFVSQHARFARNLCTTIAYKNFYSYLPDTIMDEMLREFIDDIAARDPDKTDFLLSRYKDMAPPSLKSNPVPSSDSVGVLRSR